MAGSFVFVQYTGDDAGEVLAGVLGSDNEDSDEEKHEHRPRRVIGFQLEEVESHTELAPRPDHEELEDEDDEGDDGEQLGE